MADATDFDDLLACLDVDPNSAGLPLHHHELQQLHSDQATIGQERFPFNSVVSSMSITGTNNTNCNPLENTKLAENQLLSETNVDSSFSSVEPSDPLQGGSSLGSLFVLSVDETLSNEQTHTPKFAPPNNQTALTSSQPKSKNIVPKTTEKSSKSYSLPGKSTTSQQMSSNNGLYMVEKPGYKPNIGTNQARLPQSFATSNEDSYKGSQAPESFERSVYPQSAIHSLRLQPNASGDNVGYHVGAPKLSPCGSVDSNFAPCAPLSSNSLTSLSVHRSPTPLSSQPTSSNRSSCSTSMDQVQQQASLLPGNNFVTGLSLNATTSPPPLIPDDQSHLQYLNTANSLHEGVAGDSMETSTFLDDLSTPVKSFLQDPSLSNTLTVPTCLQTTQTLQMVNTGFVSNQTDAHFSAAHSQSHVDYADNILVNSDAPSFRVKATHQTLSTSHFSSTAGSVSCSNAFNIGHIPAAGNGYETSEKDMTYVMPDGLTYTQSQILDNMTGRSKSKTKVTSKEICSQASQARSLSIVPTRLATTSVVPVPDSRCKVKQNNISAMQSLPDSGVKQMFSAYEDLSPVNEYPSTTCGDVASSRSISHQVLNCSNASKPSSGLHNPSFPSSVYMQTTPGSMPVSHREFPGKTLKAQKDNLPPAVMKLKDDMRSVPSEFNFEDFNEEEPTIRLLGQRSVSVNKSQQKVYFTPSSILPQTMQRESYSDQSVFDSVQELAALQQKQKTLMEALNARNMKSPSKHRPVHKSVSTGLSSSGLSKIVQGKIGSNVATTKNLKQKKPIKSPSGRSYSKETDPSLSTGNIQQQKLNLISSQANPSTDKIIQETELKQQQTLWSSLPIVSNANLPQGDDSIGCAKHEQQKSFFSKFLPGPDESAELMITSVKPKPTNCSAENSVQGFDGNSSDHTSRLISGRRGLEKSHYFLDKIPLQDSQDVIVSATQGLYNKTKIQHVNEVSTERKSNYVEDLSAENEQFYKKFLTDTTQSSLTSSKSSFLKASSSVFNPNLPTASLTSSIYQSFVPCEPQRSFVGHSNVSLSQRLTMEGKVNPFDPVKMFTTVSQDSKAESKKHVVGPSLQEVTYPQKELKSTFMSKQNLDMTPTMFTSSNSSTTDSGMFATMGNMFAASMERYPLLPDMSHIQLEYKPSDSENAVSIVLPAITKPQNFVSSTSALQSTQPSLWSTISAQYPSYSVKNTLAETATFPRVPAVLKDQHTISRPSLTSSTGSHSSLNASNFFHKAIAVTSGCALNSSQNIFSTTNALQTHLSNPVYPIVSSVVLPRSAEASYFPEMLHFAKKKVSKQSTSPLESVEQCNVRQDRIVDAKTSASLPPSNAVSHGLTYSSNELNSSPLTKDGLSSSNDKSQVTVHAASTELFSNESLTTFKDDKPTTLTVKNSQADMVLRDGQVLISNSTLPALSEKSVSVSSAIAQALPCSSQVKLNTDESANAQMVHTNTSNILKDKTYHGPKKKHILEKYSQQHQKFSSELYQQPITSQKAKTAEQKPCPDKASKLLNERSCCFPVKATPVTSSGKTANGCNSMVDDVSSISSNNITESFPAAMGNQQRNKSKDLPVKTVYKETSSSFIANNRQAKSDNPARTEGKPDSLLCIFDSLLQEASESAADSLKNQPKEAKIFDAKSSKEGTSHDAQEKCHVQTTASQTKCHIKLTESITSTINSKKQVTGITKASTSDTSSVVTNRAPAAYPFKWRHLQNKTTPNSGEPVRSSASVVSASEIVPSKQTILNSSVSSKVTTTSSSSFEMSMVSTIGALSTAVVSCPAVATSTFEQQPFLRPSIKLRITAFRSSNGQVIHQSKVVSGLLHDDVDFEESSYSKNKKKRKYKKTKKVESSFLTCLSPTISVANFEKDKTSKNHVNDDCTSSGDGVSLNVNSSDSEVGNLSSKAPKKRKKKHSDIPSLPNAKKICTNDAGSSVNAESHEQRGRSVNNVKKSVSTNTCLRYKPKSNPKQTDSHANDISTCLFSNRSGKLPMYLNASVNQSASSSSNLSVPTIQLVSRPNVKSSHTASVVSSAFSNQTVSVKLSKTESKNSSTEPSATAKATGIKRLLLQKSPVVTSGPQRIIIPNLTSPTFPVGKATVFTVSSSGARVSNIPTIQLLSSPIQTSSSVTPTVVSPTKPVFVKRVPISWLSKVSNSSSPVLVCNSLQSSKVNTSSVQKSSLPSYAAGKPSNVLLTTASNFATLENKLSTTSVLSSVVLPSVKVASETCKKNQQTKCSTETEFQATFSKLISSPNPLNKYIPPPVPERLRASDTESQVHPCSECGDAFIFHANLRRHYGRKSVIVKVHCVQCNQMMVFFNKCEILRHAREHSDQGDVMQFNGAHLTPITLALCKPREKEYFLELANEGKEDIIESGTNLINLTKDCTECQFVADNKCSLEDHFQRKAVERRTCDICRLPLHNQCVFSAHMRMHRHAPPHTCPECGQTFDGSKMDFNLHLRIHCFHLSRASCYKCKLCNFLFPTDDQLRHHLRLNHVQVFYKCRECPMAFKTAQNIANHQRSAHNLAPEPTNVLKTIYKCPLCDSVFTDSGNSQQLFVLHKHFDLHISSTRIIAYKCYLCSNIFEQKFRLRDHLQSVHAISSLSQIANTVALSAIESNNTDQPTSVSLSSSQGHKQKRCSDGKKAVIRKKRKKQDIDSTVPHEKQKDFTDNSRFAEINTKIKTVDDTRATKAHSARQPFKMRIKGLKSPPEKKKHLCRKFSPVKIVHGKKVYPCTECDKEFSSSHSRSSHVRSIHRGIRALYCCTHCPGGSVKFAKRVTLVKHLERLHRINAPQKEDIKIMRTHLVCNPDDKSQTLSSHCKIDKPPPGKIEKHFPRKKITRNPARRGGRRLVASGSRWIEERLGASDSDESFGEVDERTVEDGWSIEEEPEPKRENSHVGEVDASMFPFPEIYTCIKCDFQHRNRLVFQDHIMEHSRKTLENPCDVSSAAFTMVQCTECGLCFASLASLDKHLRVKHKIKHRALLERYDAKLREERNSKQLIDSNGKPDTSGLVANLHRCKVCFRKFAHDTELKTHMRTHGLAFVKSKQH
ncbi:uncharacterized protein LOC143445193 isoform X1 [Clavelina lepadiformis]|uniref:uncharacterized protein LOC143445193 isoform X1 n=1 Tax=Clavelina lepadiformis TaxID=159417 RepID=UPI004042CFE5